MYSLLLLLHKEKKMHDNLHDNLYEMNPPINHLISNVDKHISHLIGKLQLIVDKQISHLILQAKDQASHFGQSCEPEHFFSI